MAQHPFSTENSAVGRWEQNNIFKSCKSPYVVLKYDQNANEAEAGSVSWTSHWVYASPTTQKDKFCI